MLESVTIFLTKHQLFDYKYIMSSQRIICKDMLHGTILPLTGNSVYVL